MDHSEAIQAALEIVKAQASTRPMVEEEITSMIANVTAGILAAAEPASVPVKTPTTVMDPSKAVKENSVTCMECGKLFKVISKKHLAHHGLTPEEYREKYGYIKGEPLAAKTLQRERRKRAKDIKLWEKRRKPAAASEEKKA
uniref:Putative transcriptional regulator n=1 Tax=Desulfovibrio sp. U5L TaxID=596152 RepID=I2Q043_9BACT